MHYLCAPTYKPIIVYTVYTCVCIYIYICCIYRERERDVCIHIYIYIYTPTHSKLIYTCFSLSAPERSVGSRLSPTTNRHGSATVNRGFQG